MSSDAKAEDRPDAPEPPRPLAYIAALLEVGIVAVLVAEHSIAGLALCACYFWFSATWMIFASLKGRS